MSRPDDLPQSLDDDAEAHLFNRGDKATPSSANGDETRNRTAPSLVSLPWARHWAAADAATITK